MSVLPFDIPERLLTLSATWYDADEHQKLRVNDDTLGLNKSLHSWFGGKQMTVQVDHEEKSLYLRRVDPMSDFPSQRVDSKITHWGLQHLLHTKGYAPGDEITLAETADENVLVATLKGGKR